MTDNADTQGGCRLFGATLLFALAMPVLGMGAEPATPAQVRNDADTLWNKIDELELKLTRKEIEIEELQIKNKNLSSLFDKLQLEIDKLRSQKKILDNDIKNMRIKNEIDSQIIEESKTTNELLRSENIQLQSQIIQLNREVDVRQQLISKLDVALSTPSLPPFVDLAPAEVNVPRIGVDGVIYDTAGTRKTRIDGVRISRRPVLVGDFKEFCGDTGHNCTGIDDRADTEAVSKIHWTDAAAYVDWLAAVTGKRYRLPSYAELLIAPPFSAEHRLPEFTRNQYQRNDQWLVAVMDSRAATPTAFRDRFLLVGRTQVLDDTTFRLVSADD